MSVFLGLRCRSTRGTFLEVISRCWKRPELLTQSWQQSSPLLLGYFTWWLALFSSSFKMSWCNHGSPRCLQDNQKWPHITKMLVSSLGFHLTKTKVVTLIKEYLKPTSMLLMNSWDCKPCNKERGLKSKWRPSLEAWRQRYKSNRTQKTRVWYRRMVHGGVFDLLS